MNNESISELCLQMESLSASDLFVTEGALPAMRQNGLVLAIPDSPPVTKEAIQKFIRDFLPGKTEELLARQKDLDLSTAIGGEGRFRVNLSYQRGLLALAIRRIPSGEIEPTALRIPHSVLELAGSLRGLILVTGATGSGKSTTLACMLNYINSTMKKHIVTIEDPIEFVHKDKLSFISQREIGNDTADFSMALRHVVRQNPDVIFIGEIRDRETIATAISAAMTGHLVAATMHTLDTAQTLERLLSYYPDGMREQVAIDLAHVLCGIVSQRLLPGINGKKRLPAFEVLLNTPSIQRAIASQNISAIPDFLNSLQDDRMFPFSTSILKLVQEQLVELETAAAFATNKDEFMLLVQGVHTGTDTLKTYSADPDQGLSIKKLLRDSIHHSASDLILTVGTPPMVRIDGMLRAFDMPKLTAADTQKLLYSVLNSAQKAELEENREIDFALTISGLETDESVQYRFRVNGFYQKGCIASAMRIIPSHIPSSESLGLPKAVIEMTTRKQGLVLVTGPTGSGKSTTLAALIDIINHTRPCHIITVEDPIEFVHNHNVAVIEQREIHSDTHSFANALKFVLRQDPDVILVGEMRDPETIATVLTAAETGHLVFATLHTNDVAQSIDRIIDVFPSERQNQIRSQLAACIECIISQRLLPCCGPKGGRVAAFEVLLGTTPIKAMIRDKKTHQLMGAMETASRLGMITMDRALDNLLQQRLITQETYKSMVMTKGIS